MIFHPDAGMDALAVSRRERGGRDGIAIRAFENPVPYVSAHPVASQGKGRWSEGDSKIVAADGTVLRPADYQEASVIVSGLDLGQATGRYAVEALSTTRFLAASWKRMVARVRRQAGRGGPA